jgi:hypothetical protein
MKMTIFKLVVVVAVYCSALLGCGRGHPVTLETRTMPKAQQLPVATMTIDELSNILSGLTPTNCARQEIVVWTNKAGDKSMGITRDGGVWFRMKF